ncbi:MAG TPA: ATP synthase F0 subunit B [Polyangiaceae bacterium]|nr:ATP synthase F0 subunit B [Polyangiaceae bacterium]
MSRIRSLQWLLAAAVLGLATLAFAGGDDPAGHDAHAEEGSGAHGDAHAGAAHAGDPHAGETHGHHVPTWDDINWDQGLMFESEDSEPGLLTRKPGTPVPFLSMAINSALLFLILIGLGGPKVREALKARKAGITSGMVQAAAMRDEAEARLKDYENKLAHIDEQIEAAKQQIRDLANVERDQVLKEARAKRDRMMLDAHQLIEQELKAAREILMEETVKSALKTAHEMIQRAMSTTDQQRLQSEYLASLRGNDFASANVTGARGQT